MNAQEASQRERVKSKKNKLVPIIGLVLAVIVAGGLFRFCELEKPQITLVGEGAPFGAKRDLKFMASDGRSGIRGVSITLVQNGKSVSLYEKSFPRANMFSGGGPDRLEEALVVEPKGLGLTDGPAELIATVHDFSWWNWLDGNETTLRYQVTIDTKPPLVTIEYAPHYIMAGGSGIVVYRVSEEVSRHGVAINELFFPGYPVTEPFDGRYVAFFGLPHDLARLDTSRVVAVDGADNQGLVTFGMNLKKPINVHDNIVLSEEFLTRKLPEFAQNYPDMKGTLLEQYLYVNNQVRAANNKTIAEVCKSSNPKRLWQGRFLRMRGSPEAGFADHRNYFFADKDIDQQVHLGIDIASTTHAPIKAANRGLVVFADYLGIYGNTVILDHGQGVFSLYGHLNRIEAAKGQMVEADSVIGISGDTGMAGGDHLHFSMLIGGVFVTPIEWWDEHWLKLNITDFL